MTSAQTHFVNWAIFSPGFTGEVANVNIDVTKGGWLNTYKLADGSKGTFAVPSELQRMEVLKFYDKIGVTAEYTDALKLTHALGATVKTVVKNDLLVEDGMVGGAATVGIPGEMVKYCVAVKAAALALLTDYFEQLDAMIKAGHEVDKSRDILAKQYKGIFESRVSVLRTQFSLKDYAEYAKKRYQNIL